MLGVLGLTESFPVAACYIREQGALAVFFAAGTPVPFKLMTITAGFIEMNLLEFTLAALAGRALIFMVVGVLFQLFGAPIKAVIDKYLGWVTTAFVVHWPTASALLPQAMPCWQPASATSTP